VSMYFRLFANCVLSKGAKESIICDLQHGKIFNIPNLLFDILEYNRLNRVSFDDLLLMSPDVNQGLKEYINLLRNEELGFFTREPENFPEIEWSFAKQFLISNAIISIDKNSNPDTIISLFSELIDVLCCWAIELRLIDQESLDQVGSLLKHLNSSKLRSLTLFVKYQPNQENILSEALKSFPLLSRVIAYDSPWDGSKKIEDRELEERLFYSTDPLIDSKKIDPSFNFVPTIDVFCESRNQNVGLNAKIFVDENLVVRNYPGHSKDLGRYKRGELKSQLANISDLFNWHVTKDNIAVCRDCKYRPICVDFCEIIASEDSFKRSQVCNYSPYQETFS
jgi:SPASM domain peptide maturase of grasp-with-spasm system